MNPLSIVIADDNIDHAESLAMVLNLWGHKINVCLFQDKTIECCLKHCPDVILLDIGFPLRSDGLSLARQLREWPSLNDAAIIACTCFSDPETRGLALEAEFDHLMVKPMDLDELKQILAIIKPKKKTQLVQFVN
ncbi:MAG: response regulator [Gemmatales bacterium]